MQNKKKEEQEKDGRFTCRVSSTLVEEFAQATKQQDETASQAVRKFMRQYIKQAQKLAQTV